MQILFAVSFVSACSIFPYQLKAQAGEIAEVKATQKSLSENTQEIRNWIAKEETKDELEAKYQKEREDTAPAGFRWDSRTNQYVKIKK